MATTKRLIGKDGKICTASKGTVITGDGTKALDVGYYVATNILATGSGLPTGLKTNYVFYANTTAAIKPATGEKVIPLTFTEKADAQSSTLEFKSDEVDVTTLADDIKSYRAGYTDISGKMEGVTTLGVSEGFIKKFMPTVVQSADLKTVTITEIDNNPLYLITEVNSASTNSEPIAMFITPVALTSFSAGAKTADAQTFSSDYRVTPDDDIIACFLEVQQAA